MMGSEKLLPLAEHPKSVVLLETVSVLMVAADMIFGGNGFGIDLFVQLLWWLLIIWLVLKVTRRGSRRARIALTTIIVVGLVVLAWAIAFVWDPSLDLPELLSDAEITPIAAVSAVVVWGLSLGQIALLWWPSTSQWIAHHRPGPLSG